MNSSTEEPESKTANSGKFLVFGRTFFVGALLAGAFQGLASSIIFSISNPRSYFQLSIPSEDNKSDMYNVNIPTDFNWGSITSNFIACAFLGTVSFLLCAVFLANKNNILVKSNEAELRKALISWVPLLAILGGIGLCLGKLSVEPKTMYPIAYSDGVEHTQVYDQIRDQVGWDKTKNPNIQDDLRSEQKIKDIKLVYENLRESGQKEVNKYNLILLIGACIFQWYLWSVLLSNIITKSLRQGSESD